MSSTLVSIEMTVHGTGTIRISTISDNETGEGELIHQSAFQINDLHIDFGSLEITRNDTDTATE